MQVTVKLFGSEAAAVGQREVTVEVPEPEGAGAPEAVPTVGDVRRALARTLPELAEGMGRRRLAVNHAFADDRQEVGPGDEVALIGQVSGG